MRTIIFLMLSITASAQTKAFEFDEAYFRGQIQFEDDSVETLEDTKLSTVFDIHQWIVEVDTTFGAFAVYGFREGEAQPFWSESYQGVQKWGLYDGTTRTLTVEDVDDRVGITLAYKRKWYISKTQKRSRRWEIEWIAIHSLDYPDYSTRLFMSRTTDQIQR